MLTGFAQYEDCFSEFKRFQIDEASLTFKNLRGLVEFPIADRKWANWLTHTVEAWVDRFLTLPTKLILTELNDPGCLQHLDQVIAYSQLGLNRQCDTLAKFALVQLETFAENFVDKNPAAALLINRIRQVPVVEKAEAKSCFTVVADTADYLELTEMPEVVQQPAFVKSPFVTSVNRGDEKVESIELEVKQPIVRDDSVSAKLLRAFSAIGHSAEPSDLLEVKASIGSEPKVIKL